MTVVKGLNQKIIRLVRMHRVVSQTLPVPWKMMINLRQNQKKRPVNQSREGARKEETLDKALRKLREFKPKKKLKLTTRKKKLKVAKY